MVLDWKCFPARFAEQTPLNLPFFKWKKKMYFRVLSLPHAGEKSSRIPSPVGDGHLLGKRASDHTHNRRKMINFDGGSAWNSQSVVRSGIFRIVLAHIRVASALCGNRFKIWCKFLLRPMRRDIRVPHKLCQWSWQGHVSHVDESSIALHMQHAGTVGL